MSPPRRGPRTHGRSSRIRRRDPWTLVAAIVTAILLASLVPVPDLAIGCVPDGGQGAGLLPAWVGVTTLFHLVGYAALGAAVTRAAHATPTVERSRRADDRETDAVSADADRNPAAATSLVAATAVGIPVATVAGILVATAVGFGVEFAQSTVPWRSFAWTDAGVNTIGAAVGSGGYAVRQIRSSASR
ncbi:VanZ family protein [Halorubrum laminariae]|uniref:VanZ family protein n=1 Tax=Halorubrum laminariae TaxID=1433523 RepID=A0ABD6BVD2_9EURY|nr:VanZ family protein [Halorubrum laminariae]